MSIRKAEVAGQGGQGRPKSSPDLFTGFGACLLNEIVLSAMLHAGRLPLLNNDPLLQH